jgi:hypothetical protein
LGKALKVTSKTSLIKPVFIYSGSGCSFKGKTATNKLCFFHFVKSRMNLLTH